MSIYNILSILGLVSSFLYSVGVAPEFFSWAVLIIYGFTAFVLYIGIPLVLSDDESFQDMKERLQAITHGSNVISFAANLLAVVVIAMAFSPYLAMAIIPAYTASITLFLVAKAGRL